MFGIFVLIENFDFKTYINFLQDELENNIKVYRKHEKQIMAATFSVKWHFQCEQHRLHILISEMETYTVSPNSN